MADRENVIVNLQILRTWCAVNPRYGMGLDADECKKAVGWLDEAIELLTPHSKMVPVYHGKVITEEEAAEIERAKK